MAKNSHWTVCLKSHSSLKNNDHCFQSNFSILFKGTPWRQYGHFHLLFLKWTASRHLLTSHPTMITTCGSTSCGEYLFVQRLFHATQLHLNSLHWRNQKRTIKMSLLLKCMFLHLRAVSAAISCEHHSRELKNKTLTSVLIRCRESRGIFIVNATTH